MQPQPILSCWFSELTPKQHLAKDAALDEAIRTRMGPTLESAVSCLPGAPRPRGAWQKYWCWTSSRAMCTAAPHHSRPRAFTQDALALALALELVASERGHSESPAIHAQATLLFSQPGLESNLDFELRHQAIITRFGRYPHRNAILGRRPKNASFSVAACAHSTRARGRFDT
jgi:Bacterial protein of unknown function (DUF924)